MLRLVITSKIRGRFIFTNIPNEAKDKDYGLYEIVSFLDSHYGRGKKHAFSYVGIDQPDVVIRIEEWNQRMICWEVLRQVSNLPNQLSSS